METINSAEIRKNARLFAQKYAEQPSKGFRENGNGLGGPQCRTEFIPLNNVSSSSPDERNGRFQLRVNTASILSDKIFRMSRIRGPEDWIILQLL